MAGRARKLGFISPLTCLIALIFVPITTHAGEWLEGKLEQNGEVPAIAKHADLGDTFLWYAILLFLASAAVWWFGRTYELSPFASTSASSDRDVAPSGGSGSVSTLTRTQPAKTALPVWASVASTVVVVAVAAVVVFQLYRVGDSGAHAAWDYVQQIKGN